MNKLKLTLESLTVETFDTTAVAKENGTVLGEECTCPTACTCPGCESCDPTCVYTCDDRTCDGQVTCYDTCALTCGYESCRPVDCGQSYKVAECQQYP